MRCRPVEERGSVGETLRDRLGELSGGIHVAVEHVGDRSAARLPEEPSLEDPRDAVGERQGHDAAVGEDDDDVRVDRQDGVEELELHRGQVDVLAVVALGFFGGREAQEEHREVTLRRRVDGGRPQLFGAFGAPEREARRPGHDGVPGLGGDLGRHVVDARRVDERRARTLEARLVDEGADEGDRSPGREREDAVLVTQQHDGESGRFAREGVMRVDMERSGDGAGADHDPAAEFDRAPGREIQRFLGQVPGADGRNDLGIRTAARRGHLEVHPVSDPCDTVADGAPVGDDEPLEAPLIAQHAREQPRVFRRVDAVETVVGAHDGPRLCLFDDGVDTSRDLCLIGIRVRRPDAQDRLTTSPSGAN